jgi:hypothetical protein
MGFLGHSSVGHSREIVSLRRLESLSKKKNGLKIIVAVMKIIFTKLIEKITYFAASNAGKVV